MRCTYADGVAWVSGNTISRRCTGERIRSGLLANKISFFKFSNSDLRKIGGGRLELFDPPGPLIT